MHLKFEERIGRLRAERGETLYAGLIALADSVARGPSLPGDAARILRQLGCALAACSHDEMGRMNQLRLLEATIPLLELIATALASRYGHEAAMFLQSVAKLMKSAEQCTAVAGGRRAPGGGA